MRGFVIKLVKIILLILAVYSVYILSIYAYGRHRFLNDKKIVNRKGILLSTKHIFILGHSHPECALNDSFLDKKFVNLAHGGEPLFYTCIKARALTYKIPNSVIVIEFTNNSLETINGVLDDDRLLKNYKKYFFQMNLAEHSFLWAHNTQKALKSVFSLRPGGYSNIIDGGYRYLSGNEKGNATKQKKYPRSLHMVNYLKLVEFIRAHEGTKVIITRMPQYRLYDRKYVNEYAKCIKELTSFSNCRYIDFDNGTFADSLFSDHQHLNSKGAKIFSPQFNKRIDSLLNDW